MHVQQQQKQRQQHENDTKRSDELFIHMNYIDQVWMLSILNSFLSKHEMIKKNRERKTKIIRITKKEKTFKTSFQVPSRFGHIKKVIM